MIHSSIISTIGNTPLVSLNKVSKGIKGRVLAKVEYFNPGNSAKDRIALKMIENAEKEGLLKPGGVIIEGTSGNTGMGLALVAIAKGYHCIFTVTDKQSKEKIDILKAMGAEVIVCPTNVVAEDPRSYYSVAKKLHKKTANSFYPNQYDNCSNTLAHYESTGPEIWEQTEGKITHYVASVGTGGSISGVSQYLKEQKESIVSVGIDAYGSILKKYNDTGTYHAEDIHPYLSEGFGEDMLPDNVDFDAIDHFVKVTDKDGAVMARKLAREEGLFIGWSSGAAVHGGLAYAKDKMGKDDTMVILLPDHGGRYLNKIYNDEWMKDQGFLQQSYATANDIIEHYKQQSTNLLTLSKDASIKEAIIAMNKAGIDQAPVTDKEKFVGSINASTLLHNIINQSNHFDKNLSSIMNEPMPFVSSHTSLDVLSSMLNKHIQGVLVRDSMQNVHIITQHDILKIMLS